MKARVYKNLNNGLWSIKQCLDGKWVVVGHASRVSLLDVVPFVSNARHDHVRNGNHREVFAWLVGELENVVGFVPFQGRQWEGNGDYWHGFGVEDYSRVSFHPFSEVKQGFHWCFDGEDFEGAYRAVFTDSGEVYCYV